MRPPRPRLWGPLFFRRHESGRRGVDWELEVLDGRKSTMHRFIRSLIFTTAVLGLAALAVSVTPAAAAGGPDSLTCAFRGLAGMSNPGVGTVPQDAFDDSGGYGYGDP